MGAKRRPRVALAFFGIPRCSRISFPSIERAFLAPLRKHFELKVFYHLYQLDRVQNPRSNEDAVLSADNYAPFSEFSGQLAQPGFPLNRWDYADLLRYGDEYSDEGRSLANLVHQLHSLHEVTDQMVSFEPDAVLFVRPDLLYHDKIRVEYIRDCVRNPSRVILPGWGSFRGCNDRFAVCGRLSYESYGRRILNAKDFCETTHAPLHAEKLLAFSLDGSGVIPRLIDLRASRVRADGSIKDERFPNLLKRLRSRFGRWRKSTGWLATLTTGS